MIEMNPWFSGGADFPSWLPKMNAGIGIMPQIGKFQDGLAMMSFEESIFARESDLMMHESEKPRMRMRHTSGYLN